MATYTCKTCDQDYCGECTTADDWQRFCGKECEKNYDPMDDMDSEEYRNR